MEHHRGKQEVDKRAARSATPCSARSTYRSAFTCAKSLGFTGRVCMRSDSVRTNWPTVAANLQSTRQHLRLRQRSTMLYVPGEERVERVVGDQHAVQELSDARGHEEQEKGIDQLDACRRRLPVRRRERLERVCDAQRGRRRPLTLGRHARWCAAARRGAAAAARVATWRPRGAEENALRSSRLAQRLGSGA